MKKTNQSCSEIKYCEYELTCIPLSEDTPMQRNTPYNTGIGINYKEMKKREEKNTINPVKPDI